MPWKESSPADERRAFVELAKAGFTSIAELSRKFGIHPKTGFKWLKRESAFGLDGLRELSRAPKTCPHATSSELVQRIIAWRRKYKYGPRKLLEMLSEKYPDQPWPSASTAGEILTRAGLVKPRRRIRRAPRPPGNLTAPSDPNSVWCIDFKGEFKTKDGIYCWPLTITDGATRFLLGCFAFPKPTMALTIEALETVFDSYGLPKIIRSDNGTPFSSAAVCGITEVSLRWLRYGIAHERTRPATPSDNGRHERFHRTLKEATAMPPAANLKRQQQAFDAFRHEYNFVRPHEALGQKPPGRFYRPSDTPKPRELPPISYPAHFETLKVSPSGQVRIDHQYFSLGHGFGGATVGLEELPGDRWGLHYGSLALAELHWRSGKITLYGSKGTRLARQTFAALHRQKQK